MKLLIIRHAIADNREIFQKTGKPDRLRPLTARGRKRMRNNVEGMLQLIAKIDLLVSSPLVRAVQTADVIREKYPKVDFKMVKELEPHASPDAFVRWLSSHKEKGVVAAVGHEPHLGGLAAYLLTGNQAEFFILKKGGLCLLEFFGKIEGGCAKLICILQPAQLRKIGKAD